MQENTKVASGAAGPIVTIEPRRMPAPARRPSPPRATIVPSSMRKPPAAPPPPPQPAGGGDRSRRHAQAGGVADAPRHRDQAAPHAGTGLRARVAVDDDLAAAHARPLAGIDAAEVAPGRTAHHERATPHARSGPVAGVALHVQLAP